MIRDIKKNRFRFRCQAIVFLLLVCGLNIAAQPIRIGMNTSLDLNTEEFARERFPVLREAGFSQIYDGTFWAWVEKEKGVYDYKDLDFVFSRAHQNGQKIFVKIGARPPQWWWRENKSEMPFFNDGTPVFDPGTSPGGMSQLSYASRRERDDYAAFLKKFISRMEQQPYAASIVGYNVLENELGFPSRELEDDRKYLFTDYGTRMLEFFREYLKKTFGGDLKKLNRELNTDFKSFDEIKPPQPRDDIRAAETRPIWLHFMEARKRAQHEFFNSAIRAAKSVTGKIIASSELATASSPAYSLDYREMTSDWANKYLVRGDYPKYYLDTEADLGAINIYAENPALVNNVFTLARQYKKNLMVGEFNGFFRKYNKPIPEASRITYNYGWGGVIPVEPLTVYKHMWSMFDVRTSFLHRLNYFVAPTHQSDAPMAYRKDILNEVAKPFDLMLKNKEPQVLVDFTFEDVNAAPASFHRNVETYGKLLASMGISYSYGNSRDLENASLSKVPMVIVPTDSVLDNPKLEAYAKQGGKVLLFSNAWTQDAQSLKQNDSWSKKNLGLSEQKTSGNIGFTNSGGKLKSNRDINVERYSRFPALPKNAVVLAKDSGGVPVIARIGNITVCGVDLSELMYSRKAKETFSLLQDLLSGGGIPAAVEEPHRFVSIMPLINGYYAYSPTSFGPADYPLSFPADRAATNFRIITHDANGKRATGKWTKIAGKNINYNLKPGTNLVVEWR